MDGENKTCGNCGCGTGEGCGGRRCGCMHHSVMGILVVLLGLALLATRLNWIMPDTLITVVSVLIIAAGAKKIVSQKCKCC